MFKQHILAYTLSIYCLLLKGYLNKVNFSLYIVINLSDITGCLSNPMLLHK